MWLDESRETLVLRRKPVQIIHIKERNRRMPNSELLFSSPIQFLQEKGEGVLPEGGFGAVLARAGVGKTALLVQLALNQMLLGRNVLHLSLQDPVEKVGLWYRELFSLLTLQTDKGSFDPAWERALSHRFIMTFKVGGFSVPKFEERLGDLTEQNIFHPKMLLVDGLPFETETARPVLQALKQLVSKKGMHAWFTVRTHRHEDPGPDAFPDRFLPLKDLFDVVLRLQPEKNEIRVHLLKGGKNASSSGPALDPSTLLVKK